MFYIYIYTWKKYCNTKFETEFFLLDRQFQYIFYTWVAI